MVRLLLGGVKRMQIAVLSSAGTICNPSIKSVIGDNFVGGTNLKPVDFGGLKLS
jgi:hypothetical protein